MSFENMDYIIKVTRELEVGIPHVILDTSGEHECSEYCPQTDELIYTKLGTEKESCVESYVSIEKQIKEIKNEDENDVLFYRYVKGLRFWEIAEKMDCSEQWVHKLHGRALAHLRLPT